MNERPNKKRVEGVVHNEFALSWKNQWPYVDPEAPEVPFRKHYWHGQLRILPKSLLAHLNNKGVMPDSPEGLCPCEESPSVDQFLEDSYLGEGFVQLDSDHYVSEARNR